MGKNAKKASNHKKQNKLNQYSGFSLRAHRSSADADTPAAS
jgi:hypothetical protein